MAWIIPLIIALIPYVNSYNLARRAGQSLVEKSTYVGGWPLAAVPCPADAPVQCSTGISDQINQQCCPSGNTCIGWPALTVPVCCPTSESCLGQLQNVPVCANSSWNMHELGTQEENNYFCCEQDQIGVLPDTGYAGICQGKDQALPLSKSATSVNQVGAATITPITTGTNISPATTTVATSNSSPPSASSSSSPSNDTKNSTGLGSGAIAGIAVGSGIVLAALIFVLWKTLSSKPGQDTIVPDFAYGRSIQSGSRGLQEYKANPLVNTQPVRPPHPANFNEMPGEDSRAELGYGN